MLYDNAQLVSLLCEAFVATGSDLFRSRIEETIDWLHREMMTPEGAFAASLDADSEGEEGRFYVWDAQELRDIAGSDEEYETFAGTYDVSPGGNWEGKVILNRLRSASWSDPMTEGRLATMRARLLRARSARTYPALDDKVLADWNGLMISALARAGEVFGRTDWLASAQKAFRFITESMVRDGRLGHAWRSGKLSFPGMASDHANVIKAALVLYRVTQEREYLAKALELEKVLHEYQWDSKDGGYYLTASDADDLIVRPKNAADDAVPNANGVMAGNLVELWHLTGDEIYRNRADAIIRAFTSQLLQNAFASTSLLNAFDFRLNARQLVILSPGADAAFADIMKQAGSYNLTLLRPGRGEALPANHPAAGKVARMPEGPTAYLCRGETCSLPLTDVDALIEQLR